jgi:hypothetical protein
MLLFARFRADDPVLMDVGAERPMVVDFEDALRLATLRITFSRGYAKAGILRTGIHRLLNKTKKGETTHHRDQDKLNNQKYNLEAVSSSVHNQIHHSGKTVGTSYRDSGKYESRILGDDRKIYLGRYDTQAQAGLVYDWAARILYGPKAALNFPDKITASAAAYLIRTSGGIIEVGFTRRTTGEFRLLKCYVENPYKPGAGQTPTAANGPGPFYAARHNIIIVRGEGLGYRAIPVEGIETLCIKGRRYEVVG